MGVFHVSQQPHGYHSFHSVYVLVMAEWGQDLIMEVVTKGWTEIIACLGRGAVRVQVECEASLVMIKTGTSGFTPSVGRAMHAW